MLFFNIILYTTPGNEGKKEMVEREAGHSGRRNREGGNKRKINRR